MDLSTNLGNRFDMFQPGKFGSVTVTYFSGWFYTHLGFWVGTNSDFLYLVRLVTILIVGWVISPFHQLKTKAPQLSGIGNNPLVAHHYDQFQQDIILGRCLVGGFNSFNPIEKY